MTDPIKKAEIVRIDETEMRGTVPALLGDNPEGVVEQATGIANALVKIVEKQKLYAVISGRKYPTCEAWTTMGAMMGCFPRVVWSRRIEREGEVAYESRVEVVHMPSGRVISAAESMASSKEGVPWGRAEFSVRSMSETRAVGKAFRLALSWIIKLAGLEPTPAEEMPHETKPKGAVSSAHPSTAPSKPVKSAGAAPATKAMTEGGKGDTYDHSFLPRNVKSVPSKGKPKWSVCDEDGVEYNIFAAKVAAQCEAAAKAGLHVLATIRKDASGKWPDVIASVAVEEKPKVASPREPGEDAPDYGPDVEWEGAKEVER